MKKCTNFIIIIIFIVLESATGLPVDSARVDNDSVRFFNKLYCKAQTRKLYKWLYSSFVISEKIQPVASSVIVDPYEELKEYEGRIIRKIEIKSLDPFQTDVNIPDFKPSNKLVRLENAIHIQTIRIFIKNQLLFKKNQILSADKIKESERLLRQTENIRETKIIVIPAGKDSVDIKVTTQDVWSKGLETNEDPTNWKLSIYERNVLGFGHVVEFAQKRDLLTERYIGNEGYYLIPNILSSYISARATINNYSTTNNKALTIERTFYSPIVKWAGGASFLVQSNIFSRSRFDTVQNKPWITFEQKEIYLGRSFLLDKNRSSIYTRRLVVFGRLYSRNYSQRPDFKYDYNLINQDFTFALASIGISKRNFYKERFVYALGRNEDIPIGRVISANFGHINSEFFNNYYLSARYFVGKKFDNLGYISFSTDIGTYFTGQNYRETIFKNKFYFFTNLKHLGKWQFRQFVSYNFTKGLNLNNNQFTNLNNNSDFFNFNSSKVLGTSQMLVTFQTLIISPVSFIGFRFAPILFCGFGVSGTSFNNYFDNPIYQTYGLGILVKNDRLINNTIQMSFGLYLNEPYNPITFRGNPSGVNQNRLRDFDIGKPSVVDLN